MRDSDTNFHRQAAESSSTVNDQEEIETETTGVFVCDILYDESLLEFLDD